VKTDLTEIRSTLQNILKSHLPPLQVRVDSDANFEVSGTKPAMQGKQKVDGFYFASVVPKPKDIRLYFFPLYTHVEQFGELSAELKKCLKGKTCFHIKKLSPEMETEIRQMVEKGVELYREQKLI
jgi:hypothetical protein